MPRNSQSNCKRVDVSAETGRTAGNSCFHKIRYSSIPNGILTQTVTCVQISVARLGSAMPMLLWLPIIFASALFQIAASPSTPEVDDMTKRPDGTHEYGSDDEANLKAQIADQKQVIISLRAQLADMHEQMDRWQSSADRISLTAAF
jgi:hypothetical protein